jgi:phosphate-selective porin OprO/OprP
MRYVRADIYILVIGCFLFFIWFNNAQADSPSPARDDSPHRKILEKAEEGIELPVKVPVVNWHYYGKEGFRIDSPKRNLRIKINLSVMVDGGYIGADDELEGAFPDLEGPDTDFRQLMLSTVGTLYDFAEFRVDIDFAFVRDVKDNWIRFTKIPLIGHVTLGHMKEPFSLESWTSLKALTFMENALPVLAFAPNRNIGIRRHSAALDQRMTWAVGAFLNTGSFSDVGEAKDQLDEALGWDLTARITYLSWYKDHGRRLQHLGLSYTHKVAYNRDTEVQIRARPESRLTDERLVDTGKFLIDTMDLITPEFAIVHGPLSFQAEYFHGFVNADQLDYADFWGFYLFGSYFLTGEHRSYGRGRGTFSLLDPRCQFRPLTGGWGAWELAARFSYIDLNDESIQGGKEFNFTAGLNWYINRNYRLMLNYVRATLKDRGDPEVDTGRAEIIQGRLQVYF